MGLAKERFEAWWQAIEAGDEGQVRAVCTGEVEYCLPDMPPVEGIESVTEILMGFHGALPDMRHEILDSIETAQRVAVKYRVVGSHLGPLNMPDGQSLPPSGQVLVWDAVAFVSLEGGRIASYVVHTDQAPLVQALRVASG